MECHGGKFERSITQRTNGNWSQGELVSGRDPRIPPLSFIHLESYTSESNELSLSDTLGRWVIIT
jgi:hypothetical protein